MVTCAILNCGMRSNRDHVKGVRFFCVPKVIKNQCDWTRERSERRRALWITRIGRKDLHEENVKVYTRICSRHFLSGAPAAVHEESSPDWAPSVLLGHDSSTPDSERCKRQLDRTPEKNTKAKKVSKTASKQVSKKVSKKVSKRISAKTKATAQPREPDSQTNVSSDDTVNEESVEMNIDNVCGEPPVQPVCNAAEQIAETRQQGYPVEDEDMLPGGPHLTKINLTKDTEPEADTKKYHEL